jgi:uncharacterized cupredoxin-like copper-binding protein
MRAASSRDRDPIFPLEWSEGAKAYFPNSELRVLKECGHFIPRERPHQTINVLLLTSIVLIVVLGAIITLLVFSSLNQLNDEQTIGTFIVTATRTITLYAGESGSRYLFGLAPDNLTTPGPTLILKRGEPVKIILKNVGVLGHTFIVINSLESILPGRINPAFDNAKIGEEIKPIKSGSEASTIFIPDKPGTYYYICSVPGHYQLGQWGKLIVVE